jgi:hypothetical protein
MNEIPDDPKYREYVDYLVDNYIGENSNFPPKIWATFATELKLKQPITVNLFIHTSMANFINHILIFLHF